MFLYCTGILWICQFFRAMVNPNSGNRRTRRGRRRDVTVYHPGLGAQVDYKVTVVPDEPEAQVAQVVELMRDLIEADRLSPEILADAEACTVTDDPTADMFHCVRHRMRFQRDELTAEPFQPAYRDPFVEVLGSPRLQSQLAAFNGGGIGDCDCYVMYTAALLAARGVNVNAVTVRADPTDPSVYSHVYLAAYPTTGPQAGRRVPLDVSHGPSPGWETPQVYGSRKEWPLYPAPHMLWFWLAVVGLGGWYFIRRRRRR
jgi:hypothetical protein